MKASLFGVNSAVLGVMTTGISVIIVLGSVLLALTEGGQSHSLEPIPTLQNVEFITTLTESSPTVSVSTSTNTNTPTPTHVPTITETLTSIPSLVPSLCEPPEGWNLYTVQKGDTLRKLAEPLGLTPQQLADANCLLESRLVVGSTLYLPPLSATDTPAACGAPANWVAYIVQPGDTLFSIALSVGSSVDQLRTANCLTSDTIHTGQRLYVPRLPTPASPTLEPTNPPPPPTKTPVPQPTATPTDSNISFPQPTLAPLTPSP
jgi:LysM repeat protein